MAAPSSKHEDELSRPQTLHRVLTLPLLALYGLGVTVGAGIYVLIGATAAEAGPYAPVSFLLAAIVVAFTGFSYAELATQYPVSAGEAAYVEAGFGRRWLTVMVGLLVAASGVVSASAVAIGAASYLAEFVGLSPPILTMLVVLTIGAIASLGVAQSVGVAGIVTVIEIAGLLFVIGWGFGTDGGSSLTWRDTIPPLAGGHWAGIAGASLLAFFAFIGFEDMANVAEEVRDPRRTMPRAIMLTLVVATVLYVAVVVAVLTNVPMRDLANASAPLSLVFRNSSTAMQNTFAAIAVVATVNGVLIQIIMASRVIFGLADRGHLPRAFASIARRTRTPWVATGAVVAVVLLLTQTLPIQALAERTSQIVLVVFVLVNLALIAVKLKRTPSAHKHYAVWFWVPIVGVVTSGAMLAVGLF